MVYSLYSACRKSTNICYIFIWTMDNSCGILYLQRNCSSFFGDFFKNICLFLFLSYNPPTCPRNSESFAPIAQLEEYRSSKPAVVGSNPTGCTRILCKKSIGISLKYWLEPHRVRIRTVTK